MPEAIEPTEIDLSTGMSEVELSELIEVADASAMTFRDAEGNRLMDSLAIGTGFDIAMIQQGLLPPLPSIEVAKALPEADLAMSCPIETGTPADAGNPTFTDAYATLTTHQTELDPLPTHHQHY